MKPPKTNILSDQDETNADHVSVDLIDEDYIAEAQKDFSTVAVSPEVIREARNSSEDASPKTEAERDFEMKLGMYDDRTIEADLSVLSKGMMSIADSRRENADSPDVRLLAQRLTSDILQRQSEDHPRISGEMNILAIDVAKEVVTRRGIAQADTVRGDMTQLAKEIAEQMKLVNATQELDFNSRNAMQDLAFDLASQLENEAIGPIGTRKAPDPYEHTIELDSLDDVLLEDLTDPSLDPSIRDEFKDSPSTDSQDEDFEPTTLKFGISAAASKIINDYEDEPHVDEAMEELGLETTFESNEGDPVHQLISETRQAKSDPLPQKVDPPRSTLKEIQKPPTPVLPKRSPNRIYKIISAVLIFLIIALATAAGLMYFL